MDIASSNRERATTTPRDGSRFLERRALPLYAALALLVMGAPARNPFRYVVGHPDSDIWKHLWHHWLVREELVWGHVGCYKTSWINAPSGAILFDIDIVNNLIALPVSVFSIPLAVNLLVFVHLVGGALTGFLLSQYVTRNPRTSLVAGAVYAFSPYVLLHPVASGVHERLHLMLPALALLFSLKYLDGGRWRDLGVSSVMIPILVFASPSYTLFLVLGAGIFAVLDVGTLAVRQRFRGPSLGLRLGRWTLLAGGWLLCAAPAAHLVRTCAEAEARSGGGSGGDPASLSMMSQAGSILEVAGKAEALPLECFFDPSSLSRCVSPDGDFLYRFPYPGYAVIALGLVGLVLARSMRARLLVVAGAVLLSLAFGPAISFRWGASSYRVFVPSAILLKYLPFYHRVHVWQQVVLVGLLFGIGGADALGRWFRRQEVVASLALAVVVAEVAWVCRSLLPLPVTDTRIPRVYERVADMEAQVPRRLAIVLDLPSHAHDPRIGGGRYLWYQTRHGLPVPYTINQGPVNSDPLIRYVEGKTGSFRRAEKALARWGEVGVRYVVLHRRHSSAEEIARARAVLEEGQAKRVYEDTTHILYTLSGS